MLLVDLTQDLLLSIALYLSPRDILSLSEACRVLHAFSFNDYLWHHVNSNLPLDIEDKKHALSGPQLRRSFVRALQLDHNWKNGSDPKALCRAHHGELVTKMQLIGSTVLVTLARDSETSYLSVWNLDQPENAFRVERMEIRSAVDFTGTLQNNMKDLFFAVVQRTNTSAWLHPRDSISVYMISLPSPGSHFSSSRTLKIIPISDHSQYVSHVQLFNTWMVAPLVKVVEYEPYFIHHILLYDHATGYESCFDPALPQGIHSVQLRTDGTTLFLAGVRPDGTIVVLEYGLLTLQHSVVMDQAHPSIIHEVACLSFDISFILPGTLLPGSTNLPFVLFHEHSLRTNQSFIPSYVISWPLIRTSQNSRPKTDSDLVEQKFMTREGTTADMVCLGPSGHRAVWLERHWETDGFQLMRGIFSSTFDENPRSAPLLPHDLALPFQIHTCQAMAFDEASGRVCLGLLTGDMYIIDF